MSAWKHYLRKLIGPSRSRLKQSRVPVDNFKDLLFYASRGYRLDEAASIDELYMVKDL